ncbi:hypothetical protein [Bacillus pumilus]|nr:hypothetical protein [Bacillus pumilus]MDR7248785.1 hypothetical protein [Bacillus pumilus]
MTWFLDEKIQKQIPDFNINYLKQIKNLELTNDDHILLDIQFLDRAGKI